MQKQWIKSIRDYKIIIFGLCFLFCRYDAIYNNKCDTKRDPHKKYLIINFFHFATFPPPPLPYIYKLFFFVIFFYCIFFLFTEKKYLKTR